MAVVVLGLGSALAWGLADFLGGLKSRTVALAVVALTSQLAGLAVAALLLLATREPLAGERVLVYAALAGAANVLGLAAFYRGLAVGTMSIVAPIVGACSAVVPLAPAIASGERPTALQWAGMALALAGIAFASRQRAAGRPGRRIVLLSVGLAAVASLGIGGNLLGVESAANEPGASVLWVVAVTRAVAVGVILLAAMLAGLSRAPRRADLPVLLALGVLDLAANVLYALAAREGLVSLAAVLASLHPVATVLLARALLAERISRVQQGGVAFALAGVVLIVGG